MGTKFYTVLFLCLSLSLVAISQSTIIGEIEHDGQTRDYRLFIPSGYDGSEALPLVFNLHGAGSNAFEQEFYAQMNPIGEANNFFICYGNGIENVWNVGWEFGTSTDDVGFISNLIDSLSASYEIDARRIYSCGMSNGGFLSYRLACELNDRIAAVASVTGAFAPNFECNPGQSVPALEIHGTADPVVPYTGSEAVNIPIPDVVNFWVENNGCPSEPDSTRIEDTNMMDSSTADRFDYLGCDNETEVSLIRINDGGHTWPGAFIDLGVTNQDFNASAAIWEFFNRFQLPETATNTQEILQQETIKLYPNPVSDFLYWEATQEIEFTQYELMHTNGQLIQAGLLSDPIDLQHVDAGIYMLSVYNEKARVNHLIVKN